MISICNKIEINTFTDLRYNGEWLDIDLQSITYADFTCIDLEDRRCHPMKCFPAILSAQNELFRIKSVAVGDTVFGYVFPTNVLIFEFHSDTLINISINLPNKYVKFDIPLQNGLTGYFYREI